jgi:hypothetical protein
MADPLSFAQVLWEELSHLRASKDAGPAPPLAEIYGELGRGKVTLSALCLSGGGIRSATFNLGVIQRLAQLGLLRHFDYLSSVSGGGYIAGWLRAWMHRAPGPEGVSSQLARAPADPQAPEPPPLRHLRDYSNYLTPRLGLLSADTWVAAAMILRNLLLNWLVLVPVLTSIVAVPQVALIVASASVPDPIWGGGALVLAIVLALAGSVAIYDLRRTRGAGQSTILWLCIGPLWLSALCLSCAALWLRPPFPRLELILFSVLWCVLIPLAGWLVALARRRAPDGPQPIVSDLAGIVLSGAVAALLLTLLTEVWLPSLRAHPRRFVLFAVPILLGLYLLARTLFVAFASLGERDPRKPAPDLWNAALGNEDREWWARVSGWVLVLSLAWIGTSGLVLGGHTLDVLGGHLVAAAGGATGLASALLGASTRTGGGGRTREAPSRIREWGLRLLAPLTVAAIVLVLAELSAWAGRQITGRSDLLRPAPPRPYGSVPEVVETVGLFLIVPFGCTALSWLLGWVVNVNRYSGHGFYRNRLVRAYLGASNLERRADPFTGFDRDDDLPLHELAGRPGDRPLSVINTTLNLVNTRNNLAWQQRKAEPFSMTPLHCGSFREGYRRSVDYGGANGVSLGTAITISGAAANPSSGYHSSPLVAFLMTLFNVRLGAWLGNTNGHGERVFRFSGPRHAWKPLFADLFSLTDSKHAYVSLSDGGHFDNLGVYEMVLRRCRLIVASDAGEDPGHDFEDLGNFIRKVRIDLGIPIEFDQPIRILARSESGGPGLACALGVIRYDAVDQGATPGRLLYLKPTLRAEGPRLPYDVFAYSRASKEFPHESTADQFFSEAQFESYRALGHNLATGLASGAPAGIAQFFDDVSRQLAASGRVPAAGTPHGPSGTPSEASPAPPSA